MGGSLKIAGILVYIMIFFCTGIPFSSTSQPVSEMVMEIADLKCEDVWEGILKALKNNKTPILQMDKKEGYIETGPLMTPPLKGDSFQKIEEQYRIEMKCLDPLVTQITCQIKIRGLTSDNQWIPIKDTARYEKRFLENLKIKK